MRKDRSEGRERLLTKDVSLIHELLQLLLLLHSCEQFCQLGSIHLIVVEEDLPHSRLPSLQNGLRKSIDLAFLHRVVRQNQGVVLDFIQYGQHLVA